ncbi:MAG: F0F1 ATP synthase subunit delta [Sulfurospirillum sp.]|nr:MAG: F0F1 ATP synthase subunit delta [Sulfurospirillum sp.]
MSDIAKRYVKALTKSVDEKTIELIYNKLKEIVPAFKEKKFRAIIESSDISKDQKVKFLLGLTDLKEPKFENFIKLLAEKKRLGLLPEIVHELNSVIEKNTNTFHGNIVSGSAIAAKEIEEIEKILSKKFNATIKLDNIVSDYKGMKVEVENLGVEIGLSTDRIKQQIAQTILSAI